MIRISRQPLYRKAIRPQAFRQSRATLATLRNTFLKNCVYRVTGSREFIQVDSTTRQSRVLFFIPQSVGGIFGQDITSRDVRRYGENTTRKYQTILTDLAKELQMGPLRSRVLATPLSIARDAKFFDITGHLIGTHFAREGALRYLLPESELQGMMQSFYNELVQNILLGISRQFSKNLHKFSQGNEFPFHSQKIPDGQKIMFYIPFGKIDAKLRDRWLDASGVEKPTTKKHANFLYFNKDSGKIQSGFINEGKKETDFWLAIRNQYFDLFESSINDYLNSRGIENTPWFFPRPKLVTHRIYTNPGEKNSPVLGIGIGILFLSRSFSNIEWGNFVGEVAEFSRFRSTPSSLLLS